MADALTAINSGLLVPLLDIWNGALKSIPGLVAALLVLIVGYIVAWAISYVLEHILERIKLDQWVVHQTHMKKLAGGFRLSHLISVLVKWFSFIVFLSPAASLLGPGLSPLAEFLQVIALWVPQAIGAILLAFFGFVAAEYVAWKVMALEGKSSHIISGASKNLILILTLLVVLGQLGINITVASGTFLIIVAGIMLGLALAFGIGFGLALKDDAKGMIRNLRKKL
ncbi:hypothetical protein HY483_03510 [Candidatus Woesearchaeota archaeon]|nr:hypothetical protein [Candidatus Woesearchaeota archaeon]